MLCLDCRSTQSFLFIPYDPRFICDLLCLAPRPNVAPGVRVILESTVFQVLRVGLRCFPRISLPGKYQATRNRSGGH